MKKPKKKRLIQGRDFHGWCLKRLVNGKWRLALCAMSWKFPDLNESTAKCVRVKFVEVPE